MTNTANATAPILRLRDATVRHRTRAETVTAIDAVDLAIAPGERVAVLGRSGAGKTTLLDVIVGWRAPDDGTVERATIANGWSGIAVVPQSLGLLDELTVAENIGFPARVGSPLVHDPVALAGQLGLEDLLDRRPAAISMGERQRAAVVRAIVADPAILIADEPTAHQDERNADLVIDTIVSTLGAGSALVVATHDERILDRFDRTIRLDDGRIA